MIDSGSIKSWSARDIVLKPNECVAILAEGKVQDILSETVLRDYVGGWTRWVAGKIGMGSSDHKLIFAMTGPFDVLFLLNGQTTDGAAVKGMVNLRLQIQRDDVPKLLNIFANNRRELNRGFFAEYFRAEMDSRVIKPLVGTQSDASALRTPGFQEALEMAVRAEMRNAFNLAGVTLLKAFAVVNETDLEKLNAYRNQVETATSHKDVAASNTIADIDRQREVTLARIGIQTDIAKAQARGQVEAALESQLLELRKQEAAWEAQRDHQKASQDIAIAGEKSRSEIRIGEKKAKMGIALGAFDKVQEAKRARLAQQAAANLERQQHTDVVQEKIMDKAGEHGSLSPEVVQTFLEQQSVQKQADQVITASGGAPSTAPTESGSTTVLPGLCGSCGAEVQNTWNTCANCGKTLG
jgi:hypothetical protein